MNEVLHQAIDTVLEKPYYTISVPAHPQNRLTKLLVKLKLYKPKGKTYTLKPITAGNAYRVSQKILTIPEAAIRQGSDAILRDMFKLLIGHVDTLAYIVAVSIINSRQEPPESLIQELKDMELKELCLAGVEVVKNFDVSSFTNTIVSIAGMDIISPRETSPSVPGKPLAA